MVACPPQPPVSWAGKWNLPSSTVGWRNPCLASASSVFVTERHGQETEGLQTLLEMLTLIETVQHGDMYYEAEALSAQG